MGARFSQWIRRPGAMASVAVLGVLAAACAPPVGPAPQPGPPTIAAFAATVARTDAPVVATVSWNVVDPDGSLVTCTLDIDGDGTTDRTIIPCTSGSQLVQFDTPGTRVARLTATDGTAPPTEAFATVAVGPRTNESYSITVRLSGDVRPEFQQSFATAADRWASVIPVGVPDVALQLPEGFLGWVPAFDGVVDDLMIDVRIIPIDGPRGTLGRAGPLYTRGTQPIWGFMELDVDDLDQQFSAGELDDLIAHEMGHILGIGGTWVAQGLVTDVLADPVYIGTAGRGAWSEWGRSGAVPVENVGGLGTILGHWRESVFDNELMTGYSDRGAEPLSRLTVAALVDLGYGVDLAGADPYVPPFLRAGLRGAESPVHDDEHLHTEPVVPGTPLG
jgi:hypothetical protein